MISLSLHLGTIFLTGTTFTYRTHCCVSDFGWYTIGCGAYRGGIYPSKTQYVGY